MTPIGYASPMLNNIEQLAERRAQLTAELDTVTAQLKSEAIAAVTNGQPKTLVAAWAGVPRMTLDRWLKESPKG